MHIQTFYYFVYHLPAEGGPIFNSASRIGGSPKNFQAIIV